MFALAALSPPAARAATDTGQLTYGGGPVLHGMTPYLIFWDPSGEIPASERVLYARYFSDLSAAGASGGGVLSVSRQYTDSSGYADAQGVSWSSAHVIDDTDPYPTSGQCTASPSYAETTCLYTTQLQQELQRLIAGDGLPTGTAGSAPAYFIVTPPDVNSCESDDTTCADPLFCSYHGSFSDGGSSVVYADIPTVVADEDPKGCQLDVYENVQSPNGDSTADVTLNELSQATTGAMIDPLGNGWADAASHNPSGDGCEYYSTDTDPADGDNPDAFTPTAGGSAGNGTLYTQQLQGHSYYLHSEWSNGDAGCEMRPTSQAVAPAFSAPSTAAAGAAVSFDPSSSTSTDGFTSTTWTFGDGASSFTRGRPATTSHRYTSPGTYLVTLTTVDGSGNVSSLSRAIVIGTGPAVAFDFSPASPVVGQPVAFDGSSSTDSRGAITSYSWDFGDGTGATGISPIHAYSRAGAYAVTLTIRDSGGRSSATHTIRVTAAPAPPGPVSAVIDRLTPKPVAGVPTGFSAARSVDPGATVTHYSWAFGDGGTGSGIAPRHTYRRPGHYVAVLEITGGDGRQARTVVAVSVAAASITKAVVLSRSSSALIRVTVDAPGTIKLGRRRVLASRPRTVTIRYVLTRTQRERGRSHQGLKLKLRLHFTPRYGRSLVRVIRARLRLPR